MRKALASPRLNHTENINYMTTLNITSGCDDQIADQFNEGTEIHVRVCGVQAARLVAFCEEPCHITVSVDGEMTYQSLVAANRRTEFLLKDILIKNPRRSSLGAAGFRALFGGSPPAAASRDYPSVFTVEVRSGTAEGPIVGTFHYRLLPGAAFDRQLEGYLDTRAPEAPRPVYSPDARPAGEVVLGLPRCPSCGDAISDPIVGCENAECPTHRDRH